MKGLIADQKVFSTFLFRFFPDTAKHLSSLGYTERIYSIQWFLCMFSYTFSKEIVMRIWDLFFVKGCVVLF